MALYALGEDRPELPETYWVAPSASVIGRVRLRHGASVWWGAVLRGDNEWITIGAGSNVQDGSIFHTDPGCPATLGSDVTVGHGVILHGAIVGDNSLIGMGAILLNRVRIGRNCIVGAHALLTEGKEFPDNSLIVGAPGRVVRSVSDAEVAGITASARHYAENARRFERDLKSLPV